jgi:peptidyl-prolyl cis-trans isomerase SurA
MSLCGVNVMTKKTFNILTCLGLAAMAMPAAVPRANPNTVLVERIIARINNKIITQREYDKEREKLHAQLAQQLSGQKLEEDFNQKSKDLLRDMIDQDLMVQKANDDDINVDTDVIKHLDQIRQQYNLKSLQDLQDAVEKDGMNWEDFKDQIKRQLLMQQVISREVGSRIIMTRADAQKYFEAHKEQFDSPPGVHLAEIMVSTEKHTPAEAEKLVKKAQTELQSGARFPDVAKELSDSASAKEGGDVGFFKQGTISDAIAKDIAKVDVGDITPIIKTQYGYMIFKVLERRVGQHPSFDQISTQVMNYLYDQRVQNGMRGFLTDLRKESYIRLAPGFADTGAPPGGDESY